MWDATTITHRGINEEEKPQVSSINQLFMNIIAETFPN